MAETGNDAPGANVPLIAAMLAPPRVSPTLVSRRRLLALLDDAALGPVTIVSGEPAAGKTSLATDWVHRLEPDRPTAWLTVRSILDDATAFWRYLVAALSLVDVNLEDLNLALMDDDAPGERWITALANRLAAVPGDPVIIVDDFHEIRSTKVLDAVRTLLDRLPPNAHVVLLSRVQPPWNLSGWRMSGRLAEIDSIDLRYTDQEARALIDSTGMELDEEAVSHLLALTEGWAGGLRLALLSMRHTSDPTHFVTHFAADDELVAGYLVREVLDHQPPEIRAFLLDVSVLDDITAASCDLLRSRDDSDALIDRCRAENLFLTDFDGASDSFHLHSLVAQLLRATLELDDPDRLRRLHQRASIILEETGDVGAAIAHAVSAGDDKRIVELVSSNAADYAQRGRFDEIRSWISVLRRDPSLRDPEIEIGLVLTLGICGRTSEALALADEIEAATTSERMIYVARQARGMTLMLGGRLEELARVVEQLDAEVPDGNEVLPFEPVCAVAHWGGVAALIGGDLDAARSALDVAVSRTDQLDVNHVDALAFRSRVAYLDGELDTAVRYAERCVRANEAMHGGETSAVTCAYVSLADVAWERGELDRANDHLATAMRTTRPIVWESVLVQLSKSRVLASRGEIDTARAQLIECGQTYLDAETSSALRAMLSECALDLALRAGDLDEANRWKRTFESTSSRPLAPALRIRLAAALGLHDLGNIIDDALPAKQPLLGEIDTLLAAAVAVASSDQKRSEDLVARSTRLAEPQGLVRRFLDFGPELGQALRVLTDGPPDRCDTPLASEFFLRRLATPEIAGDGSLVRSSPSQGRVDELTAREMQVLELLVDGRSYSEIGAALFVSRNTIKSHASHIYTKLGVSSRAEAAETARQLSLV